MCRRRCCTRSRCCCRGQGEDTEDAVVWRRLSMLVVPDYRGFRLQIDAVAADGRWNAEVWIRRILSGEKPHMERVNCSKLTPEHAERRAAIWARRWVDVA